MPREEKLRIIKDTEERCKRFLAYFRTRERAAIQRFIKSVNPDWEYREK